MRRLLLATIFLVAAASGFLSGAVVAGTSGGAWPGDLEGDLAPDRGPVERALPVGENLGLDAAVEGAVGATAPPSDPARTRWAESASPNPWSPILAHPPGWPGLTGTGIAPGATPERSTGARALLVVGPAVHGEFPRIAPRPQAPHPSTLTGYRWPIRGARITLPFGPTPLGSRLVDGRPFHDGIDLATFCGDRVLAAHSGVVRAAGRRFDHLIGWLGDLSAYTALLDRKHWWGSLPITVVVDDQNGYRSIYAHLGRAVVRPGQRVRAGQLIGYEGATGHATGCHLHYSLFSPDETGRMQIDPGVTKRMRTPPEEIARIDPMLVLPARAGKHDPAPIAYRGWLPGALPNGIGVDQTPAEANAAEPVPTDPVPRGPVSP